MFRAIILPIFRSTRLCVTACGIMHPRWCRPVTGQQHRACILPQAVTHSLVFLKMGKMICPKHVELTGIINKPLLLHQVGYLYYLYQWCTVKQISDNEIYLFIKYITSVLWRLAKHLSFTEDARCLKVNLLLLLLSSAAASLSSQSLCSFANVRKLTINFVTSVCLAVRPQWTTRLPLDIFSWNISIFFKQSV